MSSHIEQIEMRMLAEYERDGTLDVAEWVRRWPDHRDEILAYWLWLRGTPRLKEIEAEPAPDIEDNVSEEAMRQALMAVALGREWLEDPADERDLEEERIGAELERLRGEPFQERGTASKAFRRAAVYAWIVLVWQGHRRRVSRLDAQKAAYFLEQGLDLHLFTEHRRKRFGPYDHTARYKDAEPIAEKQEWLRVSGAVIHPGKCIGNVEKYARRYVRREELARRLLQILGGLSGAELETWGTVHSAAQALEHAGEEVTAASIRALLARTPEWNSKLARSNFSDAAIQSALIHLARLRLVRL